MKTYVLSYGAVTEDPRFPSNNPKRYQRRLLAEGDSWFSMGSVPYENLLMELQFPERTIVVNIAEPGDQIVRMADPKHSKAFKRLVAKKQFAYDWTAILLSGGGNDLIDSATEILRSGDSVEECINETALRKCMRSIVDGYRLLAEVRDSPGNPSAGCLMIAHTYDYLTPRNSPALFFGMKVAGPWLYRAFREKNISEQLWVPVTDRLLKTLADTILGLATGPKAIPNFKVVQTLGTIKRAEPGATKKSGQWRNEIHPSKEGYRLLAQEVAKVIP